MLNRIFFAIKYADDMQHCMFLLEIRQCDLHKRQMTVLSRLATLLLVSFSTDAARCESTSGSRWGAFETAFLFHHPRQNSFYRASMLISSWHYGPVRVPLKPTGSISFFI